jgi:signal transduction histidine kinase/ActR/RegA family two-component response regulator
MADSFFHRKLRNFSSKMSRSTNRSGEPREVSPQGERQDSPDADRRTDGAEQREQAAPFLPFEEVVRRQKELYREIVQREGTGHKLDQVTDFAVKTLAMSDCFLWTTTPFRKGGAQQEEDLPVASNDAPANDLAENHLLVELAAFASADEQLEREPFSTLLEEEIVTPLLAGRIEEGDISPEHPTHKALTPIFSQNHHIAAFPVRRIQTRILRDLQGETRGVLLGFGGEESAPHLEAAFDQLAFLAANQLAMFDRQQEHKVLHRAIEASLLTKGKMLANLSHEFRTPLMAILGFTDILPDCKDAEEQISAIDTIKQCGRRLLELVDEMLDLSRVQDGSLRFHLQHFPIVELLQELDLFFHHTVTDKGLRWEIDCPQPLPMTIYSDPSRLRKILIHLIDNAIKFTDEGGITLRVLFDEEQDPPIISFEVEDTGMGIAHQRMASLFSPHLGTDATETCRHPGARIGLTVSEKMARLLGGTITVQSEQKQGSTFTLTLPTGKQFHRTFTPDLRSLFSSDATLNFERHHRQSGLEPKPFPENMRVLVVEDVPSNRKVLVNFMKRLQLEVAWADNGKTAWKQIEKAHQTDSPFDLVIMDIQMPVMDGLQAIRMIRGKGHTMPVIALSAYDLDEDASEYRSAGFSEMICKPVDLQYLHDLMHQIVQQHCEPSVS